MRKEVWKDVKGYKGHYKVSNLGNVKSFKQNKVKILKSSICSTGYLGVSLSLDGVKRTRSIHQLVGESFLGYERSVKDLVVDHIDGNKKNNLLSNLQIISHRENISKGKRSKYTKFTGVSYHKKDGCWYPTIVHKGERFYLGKFDDELEAKKYYEDALDKINKGDVDKIKVKKPIRSSRYKGVSWHKSANKWSSSIWVDGKSMYLGLFINELDAHYAYQSKLNEISKM